MTIERLSDDQSEWLFRLEWLFAAYVAGANMASVDDGAGEFDPESLRDSFAKWLADSRK